MSMSSLNVWALSPISTPITKVTARRRNCQWSQHICGERTGIRHIDIGGPVRRLWLHNGFLSDEWAVRVRAGNNSPGALHIALENISGVSDSRVQTRIDWVRGENDMRRHVEHRKCSSRPSYTFTVFGHVYISAHTESKSRRSAYE